MSLLLSRRLLAPSLRNALKPIQTSKPLSIIPRATMATGKSETHDLKASSVFDTSHITAIVTGGGTGIGLMISQALVANGAKVYITGRRKEVLESTIEQYAGGGSGKMIALPGDVSDKDDVIRLVKEVEGKESKGIQLLVNNAGIARDDDTKFSSAGQPDMTSAESISTHFLKTPLTSWLDTMQTNVAAGYYTSMAFLPLLAKGSNIVPGYTSQIVNVSSISGSMKGTSGGQFSYAASKAAFTHVSRMLASTFSSIPIRVNVIAPGVFPSEMTAGDSGQDNKSELDESQAANPSGRFGHDRDMAGAILFLVGRGGEWFNEQILYPDGGTTLARPATK